MINCEKCGYEIKSGSVCPVCAHKNQVSEIDNSNSIQQGAFFKHAVSNGGSVDQATFHNAVMGKIPEEVAIRLRDVIIAREAQVRQSAKMVFNCPFIQENKMYAPTVDRTEFYFFKDDSTVNAFATYHPHEIPGGGVSTPPSVVLFGGIANIMRAVAFALSINIQSSSFESSVEKDLRYLASMIIKNKAQCNSKTLVDYCGYIISPYIDSIGTDFIYDVRNYTSAMEIFVLAHEAGHLCLGHTLGLRTINSISRNQEREADSFASSTILASPFAQYLSFGHIFTTLFFSWLDAAVGSSEATTHPSSKERFYNALDSNSEVFPVIESKLGLTKDMLISLLPE